MTLKACLRSMRLRTLPLSLAGIVLGVLLAAKICDYDVLTATQIALSGPVSLSLDASELTKAAARLSYDAERNAIVLRVYPRALTIVVR